MKIGGTRKMVEAGAGRRRLETNGLNGHTTGVTATVFPYIPEDLKTDLQVNLPHQLLELLGIQLSLFTKLNVGLLF